MIRAQQAPTVSPPSKAISPFMTVPAFSLSVVLPGAPPPVAGAGIGAPTAGAGVFEGLLAGLAGASGGGWSTTTGQDSDAAPTDTSQTDNPLAAADPSLAQIFASLGLFPTPAGQTATTDAEAAPAAIPGDNTGRSHGFDGRASIQAAIAEAIQGQATDTSAPDRDLAATVQQTPATAFARFGASPARQAPDRAGQTQTQPAALANPQPAPAPATAPLPAPAQPAVAPPVATVAPLVAAVAPPAPAGAVEAPAAPAGARTADGEGRRAAGPARGDRRDSAPRSGAATTSPFAPKPDTPTAVALPEATVGDADSDSAPPADLAAADFTDAPEARQPNALAETHALATQATGPVAETAARGSPETVAGLAADIVRKVDGQSTRFDLQLDPYGLGKVDVAIEIDRDGKMTAALSFDSAQSAADLRGRAGELRLALEQAGFDIPEGGLTFDLSGQNAGFGGREAAQQDRAWNGRAFQRAQTGAEEADLSLAATPYTPSRWTRSGVDIRI